MSDTEFQDNLADKATELFGLCDHQNKGYITQEDLALVTEELGLPLTADQIALTFSKLDKDNNGYLTLAEFISGFGLFLGDHENEESGVQEALHYSQGHQLFDLCDRERKGYIVKSDLVRLAGEFQLSEQQLSDLFHSLDQDGNGYLTLEEFVAGFGQFLAADVNGQVSPNDDTQQVSTPVERTYESHHFDSGINSPGLPSEDAIFEKITEKVGDDMLSGVLSKGQLRDLWKALSSNEVVGFEKLTEFLTKVSQEIKQSRTQALNVEQNLKGQVEAHEMEIQKLYDKMDKELKTERQTISSHHEKKEKEIQEQFQSDMEFKENKLEELLKQQKELELKIENLNQADADVRNENTKLLETNYNLENKLSESNTTLEDTKSYVQHLQSLTLEERKERTRTAMTIAQGMEKEHQSLIKQLDLLREVNQKLRDQKDSIQAAHDAALERSPVKGHQVVTRQGSEMSKYFATFEGSKRTLPRLTSVDEIGNASSSSTYEKRKLQRTKTATQSTQNAITAHRDLVEFAAEADGAEFKCDEIFEEGELKESERSEWMGMARVTIEPVLSEVERNKAEMEFRDRKKNMPPQLNVTECPSPISDEDECRSQSSEGPLSPRSSPVGTDDDTKEIQKSSLSPQIHSNLQRVYKVVFIGDSGVGKSSFIHRYCYGIWKPSYTATIGVDFQVRALEVDRKKLALQLWDTAGQERFRSITKQYFRKADGVVIIYDLASEASYINIKSWMVSIEEAAEPGCTVMLVANKLDLCRENEKFRVVPTEDAHCLAEEYDILYEEASAKTGENVSEAMDKLARAMQEQEDWQIHSVLNLKFDDNKKKKSCCSK